MSLAALTGPLARSGTSLGALGALLRSGSPVVSITQATRYPPETYRLACRRARQEDLAAYPIERFGPTEAQRPERALPVHGDRRRPSGGHPLSPPRPTASYQATM